MTAFATVVVTGCAGPQPPIPPSSVAPSSTVAAPAVRSAVDPTWVGFDDADGSWRVLGREIERSRQRLDLQPADESWVFPADCPGCNHSAATAAVTLYAPGAYDPAAAETGEPVTVNGAEGFFAGPRWPAGPVLAWPYDRNAWATVQGRSQTTGDLAPLQDIAARLRPAEHLAIGFPLRLSTLPPDMPLTGVLGGSPGPRLALSFDGLTIRLWASDEFPAHRIEDSRRVEVYTVPVDIGGREGFLHADNPTREAAVRVAPGVTVTFELTGTALKLRDALDSVVWANAPADETSWPSVADWT